MRWIDALLSWVAGPLAGGESPSQAGHGHAAKTTCPSALAAAAAVNSGEPWSELLLLHGRPHSTVLHQPHSRCLALQPAKKKSGGDFFGEKIFQYFFSFPV